MALAAAGRIPEALRLLESLFDDREKWEQGFMCYHGLAPTLFLPGTRSMDQRLAASTLERISEKLSHEEPVHAATLSYNAANIYRGLKEHRNSIRAYHRAIRFWPEYGERQYFNAELAGILFEARRYGLKQNILFQGRRAKCYG